MQGSFKNDPELSDRYGANTIRQWRRSMNARPPEITDDHPEWLPPPAPRTESLADCQKRALQCFNERISAAMFDEADPASGGWVPRSKDRTVVVVAHSNTIRSLMAYFDEVPDDEVPNLHVPNSVPILYRFERATRKLISTKLQSAAGGSHARWLLSPENHASIRKAIQPGGMLTRAVLEAWDLNGDSELSVEEMEAGIQALDVEGSDGCAIIAVAKKSLRELEASGGGTIPLREFERVVAAEVEEIARSVVRQSPKDSLGTKRYGPGADTY
jgi:hypothetical protein